MKSTGITRKIDELGRIVIPKEIRKNLGIRDGESLEIFTEEETIILKKHSQIEKFAPLGMKLSELIKDIFDINVIITDREKILASNNKEQLNSNLDDYFLNLIDNRKSFIGKLNINNFTNYYTIVPIIADGDSLGLIIIECYAECNYENLAKLLANILADKVNIY